MPVNSVGDAIKLEGLEKSFGDWPVLWDLDLTLGWGQFLVIFGGNGVGKSTLLRILSTQARAGKGADCGLRPAAQPPSGTEPGWRRCPSNFSV